MSGKLVCNCILGIGFGLGERKLYQMNLDSFSSEREARQAKATIRAIFPKVFAFQDRIRKKAHRETCLVSRWGFIRWFWEVMRWDPRKYSAGGTRGDWTAGEDSEAAIAFLPANDAFGHIRTAMLTIEGAGMAERWGLINTIHDSLVFHCPAGLAEECVEGVGKIMRAPSTVLIDPLVAPAGLACDVEIAVGPSLAEMRVVGG